MIDLWVSRDEGSSTVDIWKRDPGELVAGVFDPYDFTLLGRLRSGPAEILGYGVAECRKRHVVGEVGDAG